MSVPLNNICNVSVLTIYVKWRQYVPMYPTNCFETKKCHKRIVQGTVRMFAIWIPFTLIDHPKFRVYTGMCTNILWNDSKNLRIWKVSHRKSFIIRYKNIKLFQKVFLYGYHFTYYTTLNNILYKLNISCTTICGIKFLVLHCM